jgi:transcriptional regulator with XRE-family HTH domain
MWPIANSGDMTKIDEVVKPPSLQLDTSPAAQGRRLRALLLALKWSQSELALRTGISPPSINRYCQGERRINAEDAYLIAKATGLTMGYIFEGDLRGLSRAELDWLPDA